MSKRTFAIWTDNNELVAVVSGKEVTIQNNPDYAVTMLENRTYDTAFTVRDGKEVEYYVNRTKVSRKQYEKAKFNYLGIETKKEWVRAYYATSLPIGLEAIDTTILD